MGLLDRFRKKEEKKEEKKVKIESSLEKLCEGTDLYNDLKLLPMDPSNFKTTENSDPSSADLLKHAVELQKKGDSYAGANFNLAMYLALWKETKNDAKKVYEKRRKLRPNEEPIPYSAIMSNMDKTQEIVKKHYEQRLEEIREKELKEKKESR